MKRLILILFLSLLFAKEIIDLKPIQEEFYYTEFKTNDMDDMNMAYNYYNYPAFFMKVDYSKKLFNNILYSTKKDKYFCYSTQMILVILHKFKFKNGKYLYFMAKNTQDDIYRQSLFKINLSILKKYDNRDFGDNDTKLLNSNNIKKYALLPLKDLLKTVKVVIMPTGDNKIPKISKTLTKDYRKFIEELSFEILGDMEFKVESNQEEIKNLKKYIFRYCQEGKLNKIKLYIQLGFDINKKDKKSKETLLMYATVSNN